ncbi:STAS domain-containing protein [Pseudomonas sp. S75]|uniref:STAS domain-containing protein n=1 Tax=unclassified Pseudomonas TaxID=196821 RepID=UPI0019076FBC|nr:MULTISPECIES: STAS domain-containing protein [unclassified Pseudomonas]MBJ9975426.1 STAS domain-containing protein [Pseudomonas sp. S30]MBK0152600.1 STAS domain-containing protein [Pseudomonas sp. S75]
MAVESVYSEDEERLTITVKGRFDFGQHAAFRDAYERHAPRQVVVDLKDAHYLDSSALGMLLMLRDHVGEESARISVVNVTDDVRKIFAISNFDTLFDIS